jgi:formylglycine-generating enzyme required for sulfatase activity
VPLPAIVPASAPSSAPAVASPAPATVAAAPPPRQQQPLAALKDLFLADRITADQYQLGQVLLKADPAGLDDYDSTRRAQFAAVLDGKLAPDKLAPALSAIESPQAKAARLAREQAQNRIAGLLASARADQSPEKGVEGLALVEQVLVLDPSNADALGLKAKITSLVADADRTQKEQRVASLLQQARDCDSPEKGRTALALLADLLKLDPANPDALRLKQKVDGYYATKAPAQAALVDRSFTNTIGMKFVRIEPGDFLMGSPEKEDGRYPDETQHKVKLTKPFMMGVTTVTQKQWAAVIATSPSLFTGDDLPVERVSWDDAVAFCRKLSATDHKTYRLPTEAEWEYACRTTTAYYTGDGEAALGEAGWYSANSGDKTHSVGQKKANAWGLYDMHDNVWQWCNDGYAGYPAGDATDPKGPSEQNANISSRVLRGGAWDSTPRNCRAAYRGWGAPGGRVGYVGFRLCLDF